MWAEVSKWAAIVISASALVLGVLNWRRTTRLDRWQHVEAVSVSETFVFGEINEENHSELIVRNDGKSMIQVLETGVAYGRWWVADRRQPETWASINVHRWGPLPPGKEFRVDLPDPITHKPGLGPWGIIGPYARIEDATGHRWLITRAGKRPSPSAHLPPRRRDGWFERRRWWKRINEVLTIRSMAAVERHPGRWHPVPILIDWLWGWRPGAERTDWGPLRQPRAWRYANGAEWIAPEINPIPLYNWRELAELNRTNAAQHP